ncbi:hypothetical protein RLOatenuis_0830 [Rickettsiales bacterium]|nr:hypothetical protein RLOatenuis_0830 [Rickettsiales bacterium]
MHHTMTAQRQDDCVIAVRQDNAQKSIIIEGLNKAAEGILGFSETELKSLPLQNVLDTYSVDTINSYVEYDDLGQDLASVLNKARNFAIKDKNSNIKKVRIKVFYVTSTDQNPRFELLIRDISIVEKLGIFRDEYIAQHNITYKTHPEFQIIDENASRELIKIITLFRNQHNIDAVFGLLSANRAINLQNNQSMLKKITDCLNKACRKDDIVGYFGDNKLMFVLLGCGQANSYNAVQRICKMVQSDLQDINLQFGSNVSISTGYTNIAQQADEIISKMQAGLAKAQELGDNSFASC